MNKASPTALQRFRDLPIRQKLILVVLLATVTALLLSGAGIMSADFLLFRQYLERDLTTLSRILGDNTTAALDFDEPQSAEETLAALRERPHVMAACIYQADGTKFASYTRAGLTTTCPPPAANYEVRWGSGVTISQPIILKGKRIGALVLTYDLREASERVWLYGSTVLGVLILSSLIAFLLSSRLREVIASPISQLARASKSVSATRDYSIRAEKSSADELGLLVDSFNEMLSGIQSRDTELMKVLAQREDALAGARKTRDFLRTTLTSITDAVISTDLNGHIVFANREALALLRCAEDDCVGKHVDDYFRIVDESTRSPLESTVAKVLRDASPVANIPHTTLLSVDEIATPIDHSAAPIVTEDGSVGGVVVIFRDITERRRAEQERERLAREALETEERLRQSAKLESLGVLAGGIAHDFNNLLVGILGNASLVEELLPPDSTLLPLIQDVVGASEKAAQLTHQMLAYSGKGRFVISRVDLSSEVEEILPLISRPIPKTCSVHLDLAQNIPLILADKSQLQQILMNLVINAAEACGTRPGIVLIKTSRCERDDFTLPPGFGLDAIVPGTYVRLEVSDNGSGMSEEVKAKIFDPFFSTKFTGRGLGLSAVLGIIRSHKGSIEVESTPGKGTTFRVYFPAVSGSVEVKERGTASPGPNITGTVLVVDDEPIVRSTAKSTLEKSGFQVILAEDGEIGVQKFVQFADRIAVVILDLTMPVMDGEAALGHIKRIDPGARVILTSGFDRLELAERFNGKGFAGFLQKPYTSARLIESVTNALANLS
jgi:PAS domain S-box-containing protein